MSELSFIHLQPSQKLPYYKLVMMQKERGNVPTNHIKTVGMNGLLRAKKKKSLNTPTTPPQPVHVPIPPQNLAQKHEQLRALAHRLQQRAVPL